VAKAEWGVKRICPHCGAHFYDMRRDPIACPKCATVFDPAAQVRRARQPREEPAKPAPGPKAAPKPAVADDEVPIGDADEEADLVEDEEEDDEALEDASELGEDEDDVAEVLDNVDEEDER